MTAPLNITARIGAVGDPDRFDPRPRRMAGWRVLWLAVAAAPFLIAAGLAWLGEFVAGVVG